MRILGQLPVELFAMQFGYQGDFFVSPPWVLEGLSHHVNVGLNFLKSAAARIDFKSCLLYTSPSPRDRTRSRMPSSA